MPSRKVEEKLYQDQLYGTKVLSPLAVAVIDSPEFQRLSGLKQLGFSDVVYRSARHSRLEHSVGTYFLCRTMLRRIVQNHERLEFQHPALIGSGISQLLTLNPKKAGLPEDHRSAQAAWRGLTEVIGVAGLLHDIGHVPFGHTLEDEFAGIYERHDHLANARVYEMLFHPDSHLARVFSDDREVSPRWLPSLTNDELRKLVYVILSWKEKIDPPVSFGTLLDSALSRANEQSRVAEATMREAIGRTVKRLEFIRDAYNELRERKLFEPFMSDVVGNTICADLLDYLPRDRMNLGMAFQKHERIQRYLTVRPGTNLELEGLRLSLLVTRKGHGGQRKDVATALLGIMRERYEMAERVYYHHKKAAASAMLVKALELLPKDRRPRDDDQIYPAPWTDAETAAASAPHLVHLSDAGLISYLGRAEVPKTSKALQATLHRAIRYRRAEFYRTLLVVDIPLIGAGVYSLDVFLERLRGEPGKPSPEKRWELERELESAAGSEKGSVIVYCPSAKMQSKEIDARMEIVPHRVLPLRKQPGGLALTADADVLRSLYHELWRCYIMVSPQVYESLEQSRAVVDSFSLHFRLPLESVYQNVRGHDFAGSAPDHATLLQATSKFLSKEAYLDAPTSFSSQVLAHAAEGLKKTKTPFDEEVLLAQLDSAARRAALEFMISNKTVEDVAPLKAYLRLLERGEQPLQYAARMNELDNFGDFMRGMAEEALSAVKSRRNESR